MAQQVRATEVPNGKRELTADVYETAGGEAYVIEVPVPGLSPDEINIEVTIDTVTVSTEPREKTAGFGTEVLSTRTTDRTYVASLRVSDGPRYRQRAGNSAERHLDRAGAESRRGAP